MVTAGPRSSTRMGSAAGSARAARARSWTPLSASKRPRYPTVTGEVVGASSGPGLGVIFDWLSPGREQDETIDGVDHLSLHGLVPLDDIDHRERRPQATRKPARRAGEDGRDGAEGRGERDGHA